MNPARVRDLLLGAGLALAVSVGVLVLAGGLDTVPPPPSTSPATTAPPLDVSTSAAATPPNVPAAPSPSPATTEPDSWFAPADAPDGAESATPAAVIDEIGADPSAALAEVVNLPSATVQPPPDATLVYAAVTASFLTDDSVSLTWSYDATVPGPDRAAALAAAVDAQRWEQVSAEVAEVQVGVDLLAGTIYRYQPTSGANGELTYHVLDVGDGSHLVQVIHRGLVVPGPFDPATVAPSLAWLRGLPVAPGSTVRSVVLDIRRPDATKPWSGTVAVSTQVPDSDPEAVRARLATTPPPGFAPADDGAVADLLVYRAPSGEQVTAEIYRDGDHAVVDWYVRMDAERP